MSQIAPSERVRVAAEVGVHEQYLYQCLTGRRELDPAQAVAVERRSGGRMKRWMLRHRTWHLIWPELVGTEGAPPIPVQPAEGADTAPAEVAHG